MKKFGIPFLIVLFALSLGGIVFAQDTSRTASATWKVQKYDLDVSLPADASRIITVKANLDVKNVSGKPASTLTLRISTAAEISAVRVNSAVADFAKSEEKINSATSLQRIAIRFGAAAPDANVAVSVDYKIALKENSALSVISPNSSQLLPLSFWYPTPNSWYFTRGADFAPVRIKATAPNGQQLVSSGSEVSGAFDQKLLSQPFLVTGNWEVSNQSGVAVYMPKGAGSDGQKRAAEMAAIFSDARTFVAGVLGKAPDVPLRIVSGRRGAGFGSGGTIIVDEAVLRRSKVDSQTAMNIAESAVKLWLGNTVSVSGEGYGIIGEGLSRFIATQFIESEFGKDVADIERLRQRTAYAAVSKRDAPMNLVSPLDDFYYPEVANKGAMVWRILAKRVGAAEFAKTIQANMQDGSLTVAELRTAFSSQKDIVDYLFDQITDMNLIIGLPVMNGADATMTLRNAGAIDVTVDITATTASGQRVTAPTSIKAASFGEVTFKGIGPVTRVEIDSDKVYPQIDYSDDIKPQETKDSDPLLAAKRLFDKQDFAGAEAIARTLLRDLPRFDDLRILLARSQLAQSKNTEAETEFKAILNEKSPTSRSIAWANVGLAEIASRANQNDAALKFAEAAIAADAEYGASLAARNLRNKLGLETGPDATVKTFFADFDKAATSNRKAEVDALVIPGEVTKFASGVSGSTELWQTQVRQIDRIDANTVLVEANMTIKLLNKDQETGLAVFRLTKAGTGWRLSAVDMFEVR
ncbi:hypothetical protein BH10ACI2_BH10ACI2_24050 [soil metagenome]